MAMQDFPSQVSMTGFIEPIAVFAAGFLVPHLDIWLSGFDSWLLTYAAKPFMFYMLLGVGHGENSRALVLLSMLPSNFSQAFGLWLFFRLWGPIANYLGGEIPSDHFFITMMDMELTLWLYFLPTIFVDAFTFLMRYYFVFSQVALGAGSVLYFCGPLVTLHYRLRFIAITKVLLDPDSYLICNMVINVSLWYRFKMVDTQIAAAKRKAQRKLPKEIHMHKPLKCNQIRLLVLEPEGGDWPVEPRLIPVEPVFKLVAFPLDKTPSFYALSYRWGELSKYLAVNDQRLPVSQEVQDFLFDRWTLKFTQYFWIDAICINQKNNDEKAEQIKLMTQIYEKATQVIIWLRPPETFQKAKNLVKMIRTLKYLRPAARQRLGMQFVNDMSETYRTLMEVFTHPWFERMWILQEVAVGSSVVVMTNGIPISWEALSDAAIEISRDFGLRDELYSAVSDRIDPNDSRVGQVSSNGELPRPKWGRTRTIKSLRNAYQNSKNYPGDQSEDLLLSELLWDTMPFQASDPRDKIFALIGLASDCSFKSGIQASYNLSADEVFVNTAVFILCSRKWFTNFYFAGHGYLTVDSWISHSNQSGLKKPEEKLGDPSKIQYQSRLPSWVPDYGSLKCGMRKPSCFGSLSSESEISFSSNFKIMMLDTYPFDMVKYVDKENRFPVNQKRLLPRDTNNLEESSARLLIERLNADRVNWYLRARNLVVKSKLGMLKEPLKDAEAVKTAEEDAAQEFWEAFTASHEKRDDWDKKAKLELSSPAARRLYELSILTPELIVEKAEAGDMSIFEDLGFFGAMREVQIISSAFERCVFGRAVAVTAEGNVAIVPQLTESGDIAVYFKGGQTPVLLRPREQQRVALLVGKCYIHGMNDVYKGNEWIKWRVV